ncbi:MAG: metallophosphatase [Planctomycetota bacterium]
MKRRGFLSSVAATAAMGVASGHPTQNQGEAAMGTSETSLLILHTNDTHSHLDPLSSVYSRNAGLGGAARRADLIKQIRRRHKNVLLLDSGDMFQGTPYFNLFGGELEFKVMTAMGYDVATLGNHEFDNGVDGLVKQMPHAGFEFVCANYEMDQSPLAKHVKPYTTRLYGDFKVGIFGLGVAFDGLVLESAHGGISYQDPILVARKMVDRLRGEGCHFIVCLSHLGHRYRNDKVGDINLAAEVAGIDLILGGHTHTFMDTPDIIEDPEKTATMVHQVGCFGVRLGQIRVDFQSNDRVVRLEPRQYVLESNVRLT